MGVYELTVRYRFKTQAAHSEVYRRPHFDLASCFSKIAELSKRYDVEFINIIPFECTPIDSVKISKVTVNELIDSMCGSGDSDATI